MGIIFFEILMGRLKNYIAADELRLEVVNHGKAIHTSDPAFRSTE